MKLSYLILDIFILWYGISPKAALQWSDVIFWTYQTVLLVLILVFTHLVIIATLLMITHQKSHCVDILWTYQVIPKILLHYWYWGTFSYYFSWFPIQEFMKCFWRDFRNAQKHIVYNNNARTYFRQGYCMMVHALFEVKILHKSMLILTTKSTTI